jgi:hypothetical protein
VYLRESARPRVSLVDRWRVVDDEEILRMTASGELRPGWEALLSRAPGMKIGPVLATSAAYVIGEAPDRVDVRAVLPGASILRLADPAYPGWRVYVDGRRARMLTSDYVFRAAAVPAGRHRVSFRYEPASFRLGLFVSLICLSIAAAALAASPRRRDA